MQHFECIVSFQRFVSEKLFSPSSRNSHRSSFVGTVCNAPKERQTLNVPEWKMKTFWKYFANTVTLQRFIFAKLVPRIYEIFHVLLSLSLFFHFFFISCSEMFALHAPKGLLESICRRELYESMIRKCNTYYKNYYYKNINITNLSISLQVNFTFK